MNKERIHIICYICFVTWMMLVSPRVTAQFSIGPGGWITVKPGGSLMVGTDLHIKSIPGASGYLVDQTPAGSITITGDISVERYLTPDVWHNVASPVSNETSNVYAGTDLVFWYNEALILNDWNFGWIWYYGATGGPLLPFRGYDVLIYDNPVTINYQATGAASVNTGNYSMNVINTDSDPAEVPSHRGWNLLGNPYPSPVDWLAPGWNKSAINDAKYIWDGAGDIYTIYLGGPDPIGINGGTRFIPSNQGFWVQSVVPSGNVSIGNSTRIGDISGTQDFYKEAPVDYPLVSLVAAGNDHSDEAVVRFIEGTTGGFDLNYDASKLFSLNPNVPQLSIKYGKQTFALNSLPKITDDLEVTLTFRCALPGLYEISLSPRTQLDAQTALYLKDELQQKIIHLNADSTYRFLHQPVNPENRFKLFFNPSEDLINNISPDSYFTVYTWKNQVNIIKNTQKEISPEIWILNLLGQTLYRKKLNNSTHQEITTDFPAGYYIVSIAYDETVINSKIFIGK